VMPRGVEDAHEISVLSRIADPLLPGGGLPRASNPARMRALRQWLRQRLARRLAVAMRDALLPQL
jgi:hypothetical protein